MRADSRRLCVHLTSATACLITALAPPVAGQFTTLVSVASDGTQATDVCRFPVISGDGRFVVFKSRADTLVPNDTNGRWDVFVRDRVLGLTERVNVTTAGVEATGPISDTTTFPAAAISANGRWVVFASQDTNLDPGDTNSRLDVFVRDREAGTTVLVSRALGGLSGSAASDQPAISADGRFVAFRSTANDLVPGDTNAKDDIFVRDLTTNTTTRVGLAIGGGQPDGFANSPSLSADGRFVAFSSQSTNLVSLDASIWYDVYVCDRLTGVNELVNLSSAGVQSTHFDVRTPDISADGRFVVFTSQNETLVAGDTNDVDDVFVRDRSAGTTERVSVSTTGVESDQLSARPSISASGRYVAFVSLASTLVSPDGPAESEIFVHDRVGHTTERVSLTASGQAASADSGFPTLSDDGRYVAFENSSDALVPGDANSFLDVFLRDRGTTEFPAFCSGDGSFADHTTPCPCSNDGAAGHGCANSFVPAGAVLEAFGSIGADDVTLHVLDTPQSSFTIYLQHDAQGDRAFHDGVLCAGGHLIRLRNRFSVGGESWFPDSTLAQDSTLTLSERGQVDPGSGLPRYYSLFYRNASSTFCPPALANVSNGVRVIW